MNGIHSYILDCFSSIDVTFGDHSVHVTYPFEFLDSPEWASSEANSPGIYDVSTLQSGIEGGVAISGGGWKKVSK